MSEAAEVRAALLTFVHADLVGPAHGELEILEDDPRIRYAAGVLFPQDSLRNESDAVAGVEGNVEGNPSEEDVVPSEEERADSEGGSEWAPEAEYDDSVTLSNTYRPSAIGMSFMVEPEIDEVSISARAATYESYRETVRDRDFEIAKWRRHPVDCDSVRANLRSPRTKHEIAPGLRLVVVSRLRDDGRFLVTVSIYNDTIQGQRSARTFFQVGFEVSAYEDAPIFSEYRSLEGMPEDSEELELAMMYRERRVFAVGHGCAANWTESQGDRASRLATEVIPAVVVPPVVPRSGKSRYLDMQYLRGDCLDPRKDISDALEELCRSYEEWIGLRAAEAESLDPRFADSAQRHIEGCRTTLGRMRAGIELLSRDDAALSSFMLVNRLMLMQQHHSRLRRTLDQPWFPLPKGDAYKSDWGEKHGYWRTFQIAFILATLPGIASSNHTIDLNGETISERDLVDLIWFPTGGGKTEAYFGVAAFTIFFHRLSGRQAEGCKVLMRYTLRLLTSQQFQRAASLICACEIVRRTDPDKYGIQPISIGLWVGRSLTPNDEGSALQMLATMESKPREAKNPFQLLSCPWCGTELSNSRKYGYSVRSKRQIFQCPAEATEGEEGCPFSTRVAPLPICVVDESIYREPPTLIIGTVDKFAMLAWRASAGAIFRIGGGPDLIIQDELHLISGPLGSMVGLYEGVIDYLSSREAERPKIVASTATIRRAEDQCRALYDRPMLQFPPSGLSASDSYFAVEDRNLPGQLYVGFLPTASSSPLTAQIRSVVALQQGALTATPDGTPDQALDPYWTLIQYFGSLKELGRAATFISADIPEFLPTMHRRYELEGKARRWMRSSEELTSRRNEDEIPKILKRLEQPYQKGADREAQALDTVLATNMISVGVDVDRLGLMMVVTQPKGTSEYIQASSRVGRSATRPGLVFTLFNAGRPRDRSHYEQFKAYHEAFYRFVEPTSVTPFAPPAIERGLHATLVIAGRHIAGWEKPSDFEADDPTFREFLNFLEHRVRRVDPDHLREYQDRLSDLLDQWDVLRPDKWGDFSKQSRDDYTLMRPAGTRLENERENWETPTSMRSVDVECGAVVVPRYLGSSGSSDG